MSLIKGLQKIARNEMTGDIFTQIVTPSNYQKNNFQRITDKFQNMNTFFRNISQNFATMSNFSENRLINN